MKTFRTFSCNIKLSGFQRVQEVHQSYINGFLEKNLIQGNCAILDQKWLDVITLDLVSGFFLKFCIMKSSKRCMTIMLTVFFETFLWGKCTILGPKMMGHDNSLKEGAKRYMKIIFMFFLIKFSFRAIFGSKMMHLNNSSTALTIF